MKRPARLAGGACVVIALLLAAVSGPSGQVSRVTFGATTSIDLGVASPAGRVVADVNQDGHADLIVTPSINIFTGTGAGSLALAQSTPFASASAVAAGDFNGDGAVDLAVVQATASPSPDSPCGSLPGVAVFAGPTLSHTPPCLFSGADPIAVQAGDFDRDGRTDLAIVSATAQGLRIFKGVGDGSFGQVVTAETGGSVPGSFLAATAMAAPVDLDGNGTLDLVVAHSAGVHIFLGNGDGTFHDGGSAGSGNPTSAVAVGDLNGDGIADIASVESTNGRLLVDFALGNGTFSTQTIATIGAGLSDVAIADIDGDGRADILVAHQSGGTIRIFFGGDAGTFVANPPLALSVSPKFLVVRDWDEDGDPDLGIVDEGVAGASARFWIARQDRAAAADTTAPTVTLTSPASGSIVGGTVAIAASASDNIGVTRVEFYAASNLIASSAGPNYIVSWNTAAVPNGPVALTARAFDAALNASTWATIQVTVENAVANVVDVTPPVVTPPAAITVAATEVNGARGNIAASPASQQVLAFLAGGSAIDLQDPAPVRLVPQATINVSVVDATASTLFPVGTTNVVFRFSDASGNIGSAASAITVLPPVGGVVDTPNIPVVPTNALNVPQAITVSFATVTQPGLLTADTMAAPAPPPAGFKFAGGVFDIVTTALVAPPIQVCFQGRFTAQDHVLHYESGAWVDVTSPTDAWADVIGLSPTRICATVTSLSPFAVITAANHAPIARAGAAQTIEATSAAGAPVTLNGTGTDPDGDVLSFRWTERSVQIGTTASVTTTFSIGSHLLTLTVSDGQLSSLSSTIVTVRDRTAPAISVPANATLQASSPAGAAFTYTASATDLVDGIVAVACTPASGSTFPFGTTTVTCTARDVRANVATTTFTVTVIDTTAPVITVPPNATVESTGPTGAPFTYTASATDVLDGAILPSCSPASGSTFPLGTTTVTCTATDPHRNSSTASFTVTVTDTTAPTLTLPANATITTTDPTGAIFTFDATATDIVDGARSASRMQPGNLVYEGSFRVPQGFYRGPNLTPWQFDRAMFDYGGTALAFNPANNSLFIVGHDQAQLVAEIAIPPVLGSATLAGLNTATILQPFTDATDQTLSLVSTDPLNPPDVTIKIGGLLPYQGKLYSSGYIYYDGRSSQKFSHFMSGLDLSVPNDTIGPFELNRPDCDPSTGANCLGAGFFDGYFARVPAAWQKSLGGPILNGNCCLGVIGRTSFGPSVFAVDPAKLGTTIPLPARPLVYYPEPHPLLEPGVQPCLDRVVCNPFIDGWSSNSSLFNGVTEVRGAVFPEGTRTVLFFGRHGGFGTSPTVPGGGAFCYGFGTADPALVGTIPPGQFDKYCYDPEDGSKGVHGYPYRYYVWAYDASDLAIAASGQVSPWTVRPYAVWPLTFPFATTGSTHLGGAAYDPQSGRVFVSQYQGDGNLPLIHVLKVQSVVCTPNNGTKFPIGTTTVQCSASDSAGNRATGSFTVTVNLIDVTAPVVTVPANATVEATSLAGAPYTFVASATDNIDGALATTCTPASGTTFPFGATTVTCSATDAHGNTGTASFTVTVADTTLPVVTVPANATIEATGPTGAAFTFTTSAVDNINGTLAVTCSPASGATFAIAVTTVTCTATDGHGNVGTASFTVTVRDTTPPVITVPANAVIDATGPGGAVFTYTATALDAVDGSVSVTCSPASGSTFPIGTTTVSCTAADSRLNSRSASFTVTVNSTTAPPTVTLTAPANGATVSGASVTVSATATGTGLVGVQFKLDGLNLGAEDLTSPYSIVWNTTATANGSHTLSATVRDSAGRTATSIVTPTVTVNNATGAVDLTVNGSQRFQTINGFQVNANSAAWNGGQLAPALDMLIDQGVAIFRVIIDKEDWEATNDNADPNVFNWTFYNSVYTTPKFENLWSTIGYLNSKGITSGILLNFMGPDPAWMGAPHITAGLEDEWVEMIASLVYYARVTRGLQFTLLGPANEVDWDGIEGPQVDQFQYALILHKLAVKLDALGLSDIQFVGPDTAQVNVGVQSYFPQLFADPIVMAKIQHLGLHNYADLSANADGVIKASAYPTRDFWMTEAGMGNDYYGPDHLMTQMKNGATSAGVWDAYTSVYNHRANDGNPMIDLVGSTWVRRQSFFGFKQLFKFAQPGAIRIGATGSATNLLTVAFYNPSSGQVTVVGHNQTGSRTLKIALTNLPLSGTMQLYLTDAVRQFERQPDVSLVNGAVTIAVDLDTYFTLTAITTPDTTPPTVAMTAPANGATVSGSVTVSATASDNVSVGGVQFKLDGVNLGAEVTAIPYSIAWNTTTASNAAHTLSAVARDASGNTTTSAAVSVTVNNPVDTAPPTVSMTAPANGATVSGSNVTVSATAADDVGVVGVQFLLDGAALGAEVTNAPYTLAWDATAVALGSHTLAARARDASGKQTTATAVTVTVAAPPPGVLAIDATASGTIGSPMPAITSSTFSTTSANELLLAFVGADDVVAGNTVTSITGAGLTWVLVVRTNTQRGTSEIWRAFAPTPLTNVTATANLAQSAAGLIQIVTFTGVDTTGTNGSGAIGAIKSANAASGAPTGSVTTTRANSWVWGVGTDWATATARTIGTGQTMVQQYLAPVGDTYWVQRRTATTPTSGTVVTINDTAPTTDIWNLSICEILPRP